MGVNAFVDRMTSPIDTLVIGPEAERDQIETLTRVRAERDGAASGEALAALVGAAGTDQNLMPFLVECARALLHGRRDRGGA